MLTSKEVKAVYEELKKTMRNKAKFKSSLGETRKRFVKVEEKEEKETKKPAINESYAQKDSAVRTLFGELLSSNYDVKPSKK